MSETRLTPAREQYIRTMSALTERKSGAPEELVEVLAELAALRADLARVRAERDEAVGKQRIDEAQCDDMTATAARLAEQLSQAEAERESLRLELAASESNRIKGNEHLLAHARALREALEGLKHAQLVRAFFDGSRKKHEPDVVDLIDAVDAALAATREEPTR